MATPIDDSSNGRSRPSLSVIRELSRPMCPSETSCFSNRSAKPNLSACREGQENLREDIADMMRKLSEDMRHDVREELQDFKCRYQTTLQEPLMSGWAGRSTAHAGQISKFPENKYVKQQEAQSIVICEGQEDEMSSHSRFRVGGRDVSSRQISEEAPPLPPSVDMMQEVIYLPRPMMEEMTDDSDDDSSASGADSRAKSPSFQEMCERLVTSRLMQMTVAALVLLNSVLIGVQTEYQSQYMGDTMPTIFLLTDVAFCLVFSIELAMRIYAFRLSFFNSPDSAWNVFDSFIISVSAVDLISSFAAVEGPEIGKEVGVFRMLRIVRVFRAIRIVRVLRFVEELRTISVCIVETMRSLVWALLLLFMVIYVAGICVTQIVLEQRTDLGPGEVSNELIRWFGTLSQTCLTLYQSITSGVDWDEPMTALTGNVSRGFVLFWIFYTAFTVFALLNVVTGVFVERAMAFAQREKAEFMMSNIGDIFRESLRMRRADGEIGKISWSQFEKSLETEEMQEYFNSINVDISEGRGLFDLLDVEKTGTIDAVEFVRGCVRLTGNAKALDLALVLNETRAMRSLICSDLRSIERQLGKLTK
eukprot:TRINITY_DN3810_c0_g1_i1.p1 TRINITY_DN3810_c0_g1~~TRINITY_DN3810_c0_g1_i1.p1  ORF type:complete len:613 (+),score=98.96 TRINITY_DN3810_c0_g1_i1:70-1839(+)